MFGPFFLVSYSHFMTLSSLEDFSDKRDALYALSFSNGLDEEDLVAFSCLRVSDTSENLRQLRWSSPCI